MRTLERVSLDASAEARVVPLRLTDALSAATVMLVGVEPLLADTIKYTLERDGYRIAVPLSPDDSFVALERERPGLVFIELAGHTPEALTFCRNVRTRTSASVILLTPPMSDAERSEALAAGVNDILVKPFSVRELAQRVAREMRGERFAIPSPDPDVEILRLGPVEMDVTNHEVRVKGKLTVFPPKEFALLETMLRSRGRLLTRARLMVAVWGPDYYGDGKTLDTHVKRLREKIEPDRKRPRHLIVVRGLGYRFVEQTDAE